MKRFAWPMALVLLSLASCGQQPIVVPGRTLDRPTDLAFLCLTSTPLPQGNIVTARPAGACPAATSTAEDRTTARLGLIANSARGEVGAVDFDRNRMIDLDVATPGFNMLPVGQLPESVAVSSDGCRAVTANRGSCDLSVIDTTRLLTSVFSNAQPSTGVGAVSNRLAVATDSGPLLARPSEVTFVPGPTQNMPEAHQCSVGTAFGGGAWRAVVTYPACGLVALVDVPSGRLVDSVYVQTDGTVVPAGTNPQCPVECGAPVANDVTGQVDAQPAWPDAGAPHDAGDELAAVVPGRLAVAPVAFLPFRGGDQPRQQLYVGGRNAGLVVPLAVAGGQSFEVPRPALVLAENARGVLRLRPSIDPFKAPEQAFVGTLGRYLYAIAADGTARVVDVGPVDTGGLEVECDTNIDTATVAALGATLPQGCVPLSLNLPRRLGARGPGVQVPPEGGRGTAPPAAVDVAFFQAEPAVGGLGATGRYYAGAFAYLLLSNGDILVLNIQARHPLPFDPVAEPLLPPAHSIRNARAFQDIDRGGGRPRVSGNPSATLTTNDLPFASRAPLPRELFPQLEEFPGVTDPYCSPLASSANPVSIFACFQRPNESVDQRWELIWEGGLQGTARTAGRWQPGPPGSVGVWSDAGAQFCASGVQPKDRLRVLGCVLDEDCGDVNVFRCVPSAAGASGLCARKENAAAVAETCQDFLRSRRRFEVLEAGARQLTLGPLLDELPRPTTLGACVTDLDCRPEGVPSPQGLSCIEVVPGQGNRCVRPCAENDECRLGFVCESVAGATSKFCAEAPVPPPVCLADNGAYRVQAGHAFIVAGARVAPFATATEEGGVCKPLLSRDLRHSNRLPLSAPLCSNLQCETPSWTHLLQSPMAAEGWPNPCLCQGPNAADPTTGVHTKALFEIADVRFMVTNLEQPFGDGAAMGFQTAGGFWPDWILVPQSGTPSIAVPTRLLVGPTLVPADEKEDKDATSQAVYPYVYMVDSGRLGTQQRGQILRLDTRRATYDTGRSSRRFEIQ